jgi:hypothetical protein
MLSQCCVRAVLEFSLAIHLASVFAHYPPVLLAALPTAAQIRDLRKAWCYVTLSQCYAMHCAMV